MFDCMACGHPEVHAQTLPLTAGLGPRCEDCPRCRRELTEA